MKKGKGGSFRTVTVLKQESGHMIKIILLLRLRFSSLPMADTVQPKWVPAKFWQYFVGRE